MNDYSRMYMPALDFIRAMNERPWWVKVLCRLFFGKYAYREFLFMVNICKQDGTDPFMDYGLQELEYHRDQQPLKWWAH